MICPKCGSENVNVQIVTETILKDKHHGCLWWLLIGWWLEACLWFFLTIPRLLIALFMPKDKKIINKQSGVAVCQNCGKRWKV